jgi:hypothetical protein
MNLRRSPRVWPGKFIFALDFKGFDLRCGESDRKRCPTFGENPHIQEGAEHGSSQRQGSKQG